MNNKLIERLLVDKYSNEWDQGCTYQKGSIVTYDHSIYKSLIVNNVGNNPKSSENWISIL